MAAAMTDILFPEDSVLSRLILAETTSTGGAGAVVTLTLAASYPPIDRSIPNPILAIMTVQNSATLLQNASEIYTIADSMVAGVAPDDDNEFVVTGDRTIDIWTRIAEPAIALIAYISKGSGNKV